MKPSSEGAAYLSYMININRFDFNGDINDLPRGLQASRNMMPYMHLWINLIKGSTQPKYLYRKKRIWDIEYRSRIIARKTGADYEEVRDLFMAWMHSFLNA